MPLALGSQIVTVRDDTALGEAEEAAWGGVGKNPIERDPRGLKGCEAPLRGVKQLETL